MSNLGQGVWEKGKAVGKEAEKIATVKGMCRKGYSVEMMVDASDKTPEEVDAILTGQKLRTDCVKETR